MTASQMERRSTIPPSPACLLASRQEMLATTKRSWECSLRWEGRCCPRHGACGHQESPARGAGASPTFARPSLWGQLLSPHLGATQVTGTQPHLCCCCFIHLLSSAVLQKLLPNYAPFFFFSSSIINIFSRVDSFPDHPPPTYTHACTYTL